MSSENVSGISEEWESNLGDESVTEEERLDWLREQKGFEEELKNGPKRLETEEPPSIQKWKEERNKWIFEKDQKELQDIQKLRENGVEQLQKMQLLYDQQLVEKKQKRRNTGEAQMEETGGSGEDNKWERVSQLLDLTQKKKMEGKKDVSRMRSIILQLKNNPKNVMKNL